MNMKTKEEYKVGNLVTINDYFRVYFNDIEGVKGYYDFISTKRYTNLKTANNYTEFANMLKFDGYATSSTYVNTLCSTVKKYGLDKFDSAECCNYIVGRTYTLLSDMYVRKVPAGEHMRVSELTDNAKLFAREDKDGNAILKKGTRVTCKEVVELNNATWLKIPSGYVCARNTKVYIM